ncbi:MAG TPA: mechanosensitive ion channel domain-containing protein [Trebonia sp.]|jgi:small-conductance mechanosensitive channel|nr:mechanosensitive ion channel domain-containing protein [Trebonia sp.]
MHLQDGPQIDLSEQVARVRARARPWRSIIALVLAIAAGVASGWAHHGFRDFFSGEHVPRQVIAAAAALAFCAFASIATYGLSASARNVLAPRTGAAHAAIVRYALVLIGAFTTLIVTLQLFKVPVGQLVLGGALTSVFVGIAAQQALSNVFAGIVLLVARPFMVGDTVRFQAGALGGEVTGTVTEIGITYVRLYSGGAVRSVPNSQVLNAVVGPVPPPPPPDPAPPAAAVSPVATALRAAAPPAPATDENIPKGPPAPGPHPAA